jgi:hypothetical protein
VEWAGCHDRGGHFSVWLIARRLVWWAGAAGSLEAGDISGIDVLDRYVTAIGGLLEIVATFGDEQFKVG